MAVCIGSSTDINTFAIRQILPCHGTQEKKQNKTKQKNPKACSYCSIENKWYIFTVFSLWTVSQFSLCFTLKTFPHYSLSCYARWQSRCSGMYKSDECVLSTTLFLRMYRSWYGLMEIGKGKRKCNYFSLEQTARHKILNGREIIKRVNSQGRELWIFAFPFYNWR